MNPNDYPPHPDVELVWKYFDQRRTGFFIEVGANHPFESSQTWLLEQHGWRGILVEPIPECCDLLRRHRPNCTVVQAACGSPDQRGHAEFFVAKASAWSGLKKGLVTNGSYDRSETVRVLTLDDIITQAGIDHVDFISIDVEGTQLEVLKGLDLGRHGPDLLQVEDHLYNLRTHLYLRGEGHYRLVKRRVRNNWYIPSQQPFGMTSLLERIHLFRKVWLSPPTRNLKRYLKKQRRRRKGSRSN